LCDKIYGKKTTDFFTFVDETVEKYLRSEKIGTYDKNVETSPTIYSIDAKSAKVQKVELTDQPVADYLKT
jgi:hypothetical protein